MQATDAHGIVGCVPLLVKISHLHTRNGGAQHSGVVQASLTLLLPFTRKQLHGLVARPAQHGAAPTLLAILRSGTVHSAHSMASAAPTLLAIWRSGTVRSTRTPSWDRKRGMEAIGPMPSMKPCTWQ